MSRSTHCAAWTASVVLSGFVAVGLTGTRPADADQPASQTAVGRPFFAFCFDTHDTRQRNLEQQADLLKELGFAGAGHVGLDGLPERLASLDRVQLQLFLTGTSIDLTKPLEPQLEPYFRALPLLQGRDTLLYVVLTGYPSRDPRGSEPGVAALRALAERAMTHNLRVGIYPHTGDWVSRVEHAVEVAQAVERTNCGVIFNLCHFLRNEELDSLSTVLRAAGPYLQAVMINGADPAGKSDPDWQRLIQPLDAGTFDVPGLLRQLDALCYKGPIGLMCWGIAADSHEHLGRSIARWREWHSDAP